MQHLPKKLHPSILSANSPVIFGWVIHITEGPKDWIMKCALYIGLLRAFAAAGLWWGFKNDIQGGIGLGSLLLGAMGAAAFFLTFIHD